MIMSDQTNFVGHLAILLTDTRDSDKHILGELGVATGIHYPIADYQQPAWRDRATDVTLPATENIQRQILTLPCFPAMTEAEIDQVVNALKTLN
jgi:dTDP-4-amino-4,6-dideoxygalactose transaminase